MINRTMLEDDFLGLDSSMKGPVIASTIFHITLFIITAVGIPFIARDHEILSQPVSVELVTLDELTQTNIVAKPAPPKEEKKELPPPKQEKPSPPKMAMDTPPEIVEPKPPELKEEKPVETPPPAELAPPKPEKKVEEKPKVKPAPKKPEPTKVEKKPEQDFDSLLKNLTPDTKEESKTEATETAENSSVDSAIAQMSDRLTMSEMDALRHQLQQCWNLGASAGGAYAEELIVEVRVMVGRDRIVQQATIVDMGRYNRDTHFRAAADAALRALRNPRCTPLALPPDKYNEWKTTVVRFDPSEML